MAGGSCASPASEFLVSRTNFYIYIWSAAFSWIFPYTLLLLVCPWGTSSISTSHWQNSCGFQCKLNLAAERDMSFSLCDGFWSLISICCPLLYKTKWPVSKKKDDSSVCVFSNDMSNIVMVISLPACECLKLLENHFSEPPSEPAGLLSCDPAANSIYKHYLVTQRQPLSDIQWLSSSQVSACPSSTVLCGHAPGHPC